MLSSAKEVYVSQTNEGPYVPVLLLAGKLVDPEIVIFEPFHYIFCKKTDSIPFFSRFPKNLESECDSLKNICIFS